MFAGWGGQVSRERANNGRARETYNGRHETRTNRGENLDKLDSLAIEKVSTAMLNLITGSLYAGTLMG